MKSSSSFNITNCNQARTQDFEKGGYIAEKIPIEFFAF